MKTGASCLSNMLKMHVDLEIYIKSMVIPQKGPQEIDYYQFHNVVSSILTYNEYTIPSDSTHIVSIP